MAPLALLLLPLTASFTASQADEETRGQTASLELGPVHLGPVMWGRNSLKLSYRNDRTEPVSATISVRTRFDPPGSGVGWEAAYDVLLPPRQSGEITADFFVRPDHGTLRLEVEARAGEGVLFRNSREASFEAPYRGDYHLQPSRLRSGGVTWDGRIFPPFRVRESEHFITYCFPGSEAEADLERIVARRERIVRELLRQFQVSLPERAVLFLYPDAESAAQLTGHRSDGWTYGQTVVEVYGPRRKIDPAHELVHLVAGRIGTPPVLLAEGLATSRETEFDNAGRYRASVESWCRGLQRESALIPVSDLMEYTSFGEDLSRPRIAYPESACFTRYLLKTHGWESYRRAYAELVNRPDPATRQENEERFEAIFGHSLAVVEADWKDSLSRSGGSRVPPDIVRRVIQEETLPYLVARGRILLISGAAAEGEKVLREAERMNPSDLAVHFWLAQALHLTKDLAGALAEYEWVIKRGDRTSRREIAWSHVWSGQILDQKGEREQALIHYRQAEALQDRSLAEIEGRTTTSLEAAREGIARPFHPPTP